MIFTIILVIKIYILDLILITLQEWPAITMLIHAIIFLLLKTIILLITYLINILLVRFLKWILCKFLRRFLLWWEKICGNTLINKIVRLLLLRVLECSSILAWYILDWMVSIDISIQFLLILLLEWLRLICLTLVLLLKLLFLLPIYWSLLIELRRLVDLFILGVCIIIMIKMDQWNTRWLRLLRRCLEGLLSR